MYTQYVEEGLEADDLEELYPKVHAAIREDPVREKKARSAPKEKKM